MENKRHKCSRRIDVLSSFYWYRTGNMNVYTAAISNKAKPARLRQASEESPGKLNVTILRDYKVMQLQYGQPAWK
ncbi:MAG: hypothetical protein RJR37_08875 [Peptococcaceae bacterium MAG4]|nr:hypothetical protein [Peptococcaceae bacterium MAG4]